MRWVMLATVAVLGTIANGAALAGQSPRRSGVISALRGDLTSYLHERKAPEHISGVGLTITFSNGGAAISMAVGDTRYTGGRPLSAKALWEIGSNTKAFTSVIILQLEAEHRLSINDTLGKWLPQYPGWRHITIKQLLDMTSGIPTFDHQPAFMSAYAANPDHVFPAAGLVAYASGLPLATGYAYSNTGYLLAQMIIERVTHDGYADQLRKRIIVPLGLRNLFYSPADYPTAVVERLPAGYFWASSAILEASMLGKDQSRRNMSYTQGAGGIISSLQDLGTWERALYTGRELPRRQQRELESLVSETTGKPIPRTTLRDSGGYGLGVGQLTTAVTGRVWFYEGATNGFRVLHVYVPRTGTLIAIGLNSNCDSDEIGTLAENVYTTLHKAGMA